jgi:hypothetical protein
MLSNVLFILLGASLVAVGVLTTALAERLRGNAPTEEKRPQAPRTVVAEPTEMPRTPTVTRSAREVTPLVTPPATGTEMPRTPTVTRVARAETKITSPGLGENVISALVAAGYKRTMAAEATWACDKTERASIGAWTAAALRRCAPGGVS